jgi:RNA methyltransferase, TrmH family
MLTSLQNPLIKQLRKLDSAKERKASGLFLVDGNHAVEAAHRTGWEFEVICATEAWCETHPELFNELANTHRFEQVNPAILEVLADTVAPSGIVAAVRRQERDWQRIIQNPSLLVLGETLQDPGNLGTIIRTSAAVGADGLLLSTDSVDPESPKVLRASAGLWFHSPPMRCPDLGAVVENLVAQGVQVLAATADAPLTLWELDLRQPTAFVLGSEGQGLSKALRSQIPHQVGIPQAPGVESLNVAVSCALLLYETMRQRKC